MVGVMMHSSCRHLVFETADGHAAIGWNAAGVTIAFRLPAPSPQEAERSLLRRQPRSVGAEPPDGIAAVAEAAQRYFHGERVDFSDVAIDLGMRDAFHLRVYAMVRQLGWGETTTYGAVARELGVGPEMAREVGVAMARNPLPLIIPCHRVTAVGGRIGGFSAPGGSTAKARMLAREGFVPPSPEKQYGFGFYLPTRGDVASSSRCGGMSHTLSR